MCDILSIILLTQFYVSFELKSRIPCFSTRMRRSFSSDQFPDRQSMDVREIRFYVKTPPFLDRC